LEEKTCITAGRRTLPASTIVAKQSLSKTSVLAPLTWTGMADRQMLICHSKSMCAAGASVWNACGASSQVQLRAFRRFLSETAPRRNPAQGVTGSAESRAPQPMPVRKRHMPTHHRIMRLLPSIFTDDVLRAERPARPAAPRRKAGYIPRVAAITLLIVIFVLALELACAPWIFVLGGRLRPLPLWTGSGIVEGPSGPYLISVWLTPQPGARVVPFTDVMGAGYLCTPRGERYTLWVGGGAAGNAWRDLDGQVFHLEALRHPALGSASQEPPFLRFSGKWEGTDLVMTDGASLGRAFLPDGRINTQTQDAGQPKSRVLPVTLSETGWWSRPPDCQRPPSAASQQPVPAAKPGVAAR
jgi:hypothetical protein